MRQRIRVRSFRTSWGLSAAAAALVGAPAVAEPLAEIAGLPDGPVLDVVRAAVGEIDEPVVSILDARRRADRARDRALAALRSEGYYAARVDAQVEPGEPPRSRLEITAGRRFVMGAVSVELVGAAEEDRVSTLKAAEEAVARSSDSGNADDDLDGRVVRPVIAEVTAGDRHTISLGATYSTTEGGGVDGEWVRRNLWGGAEELTISAALRTIDRRLGVEIAAPHWRRPGRTLRLNTSLSDETTDAFDRSAAEAGARIETRLSDRASGSLGVGASVSEVDDGTDVERFALVFGSGAISWDGSNDPLDPSRGVRANALARPTVGTGDGPLAYLVLDGGASAYRPIQGERLVAAGRARLAGVVGPALSELPANERFFAGGGGSVRGYEYQSLSPRNADGDLVGGRSVMEVAAELRYRGEGRFGYVAFLDGGVASTELTPDLSDMRWGAGVGVRYYASVGPIRADIATPLDPNDGDAPVQLYLSIGQAF